MKYSMTFFIASSILLSLSQQSFSQNLLVADMFERAELDFHKGFIPHDVETLVNSSSIIVKGRFGRLLDHRLWWGYDDTRESLQRRLGDNADRVDDYGVPLSEYEIIIDEVLLGNIEGDTVVYHVLESDPSDRRFTDESVERLFFLVLNPDGKTYGRLGVPFILTNRNGIYGYEFPDDSLSTNDFGVFEFAPSMASEEFESYIRNEIQKTKPSN